MGNVQSLEAYILNEEHIANYLRDKYAEDDEDKKREIEKDLEMHGINEGKVFLTDAEYAELFPSEILETELPNVNEKRLELIDPRKSLDYFDLCKVFKWDERYLKFEKKRDRLKLLYNRMMEYQCNDPDAQYVRGIMPELIDKLDNCENEEELNDFYEYFQLYYGRDMQKMNAHNAKDHPDETFDEGDSKNMKQSQRNSDYYLCQRNQLGEVAMKFGLTAEEFAEHVKDDFQLGLPKFASRKSINIKILGKISSAHRLTL